jgi:arylsulfatase A-like enzyme
MTSTVDAWLKERPSVPAMIFLQPMNCHGPYKVPRGRRTTLLGREPTSHFVYYDRIMRSIMRKGDLDARDAVGPKYLTSLKEQYTTAIRYETDEIGKLLAGLERAGRYDDALIVLTSDHGEELYDHGGFSHGYTLYDELLRVPLFIKLPGQKEARVVDEVVSTVDITPTVLDALGLPVPQMDGRSLRGAAAGEPIASADQVFDVHWAKRTIAQGFLRDGWKLTDITSDYQGVRNERLLVNLIEDPKENRNLAHTQPERLAEMLAGLRQAVGELEGKVTPKNVLSDMDRDQLEALGYLE